MKVEILRRPYDLYAVMLVSTLLVVLILLNELTGLRMQALRVILGLPFILFFPGYVLISALYPERKRYFDEKGDPVTRERWKQLMESDEDEREGDIPDGKGLDNLERVALSLGLSIAITPLIGLILNYTYEWDPANLGIRLLPVLFSIYAFIIITGIAASVRRLRTPMEDRYGISIVLEMPEDYTTMDKVLTAGIVLMMIASVSLLVYIIVVPREGEAFTEFYILGKGGMAEDYPRNMLLEETEFVTIGIGNNEHRDVNYTLVVSIDPSASNRTVDSFENVTISRTSQPSMQVMVPEDRTLEIPCNFSVLETGSYKMRFLLFRDGREYRDLHLWIKVFMDGRLERSADGGFEVYLSDPSGDPSGLPERPAAGIPLGIGIGVRNTLENDIGLQVTIGTGEAAEIVPIDPGEISVNITSGYSYTFDLEVNSTSSVDVLPMFLITQNDAETLFFNFIGAGEDLTLAIELETEAG